MTKKGKKKKKKKKKKPSMVTSFDEVAEWERALSLLAKGRRFNPGGGHFFVFLDREPLTQKYEEMRR